MFFSLSIHLWMIQLFICVIFTIIVCVSFQSIRSYYLNVINPSNNQQLVSLYICLLLSSCLHQVQKSILLFSLIPFHSFYLFIKLYNLFSAFRLFILYIIYVYIYLLHVFCVCRTWCQSTQKKIIYFFVWFSTYSPVSFHQFI